MEPISIAQVKHFVTGLSTFGWNGDYLAFCKVCKFDAGSDYSKQKWEDWQKLQKGLNAFDLEKLFAMAIAGHTTEEISAFTVVFNLVCHNWTRPMSEDMRKKLGLTTECDFDLRCNTRPERICQHVVFAGEVPATQTIEGLARTLLEPYCQSKAKDGYTLHLVEIQKVSDEIATQIAILGGEIPPSTDTEK